jgi:glycosyltransferase involved in cell wall biosynthesis
MPEATCRAISILVDSYADPHLTNAQMGNAREIIRRLDPSRFHVSTFALESPDPLLARRPNTRIIRLPEKKKTVRILREFLFGTYQIIFYVKASPASRIYMKIRRYGSRRTVAVGTMESQSDLRNEPTISPAGIDLWERTVLRCDYLFSNSRAVKESLQRQYGIFSDVVPTGVDTKFFCPDPARQSSSRLRVLFAGSLRPFKQPDLVLQAAARFREADFVLAGEGMMWEDLRQRVRDENLTNVTLLGSLQAEELRSQYRRADIFLFPSKWEGSPKVILEAAASGLPVIARLDYQPETVIDGRTGFLEATNEGLLQKLDVLLADRELRERMGQQGREHSLKFDWDVIVQRWQEIFVSLVKN